MPLNSNFNVNPYYDDFSEDKKFLRILFKPGYAVQARELTQLQTILQNQIERFGNNIFINGANVFGGKTHAQDCVSIKVDSSYAGNTIDYSNFTAKTIYNLDKSKRAEVIVSVPVENSDPITFLVKQIYGSAFVPGEVLVTDETTPFYAQIESTGTPVGVGQAFSIDEGVFYFGGFFIKTDAQSVAISKYTTGSASVKVGFQTYEYFKSFSDDASLVDPAQQATNYQAPGADRYAVELILSTRDLDATDDLNTFLEIARYVSGQIQTAAKPSVYNKIGDEIAKRTFDESGNYVVRPFSISAEANTSNTSFIDLTVGAGKAYVQGYEINMNFPKKLIAEVARDTATSNIKINSNFGNYFFVTSLANTFNIDQLVTVDLHCVRASQVITSNTSTISNTKIGTASIKSIDFVTASNTQSGPTYTYAVSVFNVNTSNLSSTVQTGGDASNIKLGTLYSTANQAYAGGYLRITSGPGSNEAPKLIVSYDGASRNATVFPAFTVAPTSASVYSIEFNSQHVGSLIQLSGTTIANSADISTTAGIDPSTANLNDQRSILFENQSEELVFSLPTIYPKWGSLTNISYNYIKQFAIGGTATTITVSTNDILASAVSESDLRKNYILICNSPGSLPVAAGQVVPSNLYNVTGYGSNSGSLNIPSGAGFTGILYATVIGKETSYRRSKTYYSANLISLGTSTAVTGLTGRVSTNTTFGQVQIQANAIVRIPDTEQSLYLIDATNLVKVLDFANNAITDANVAIATDVTSKYYLDTGQRDSFYDHSSIRLRSGQTPPIGPIVVYVNHFTHLTGSGYFNVDSYLASGVSYANISNYTASSGKYYELRDSFDFRPSVIENNTTKTFNYVSTPLLPKRGSDITVTYDYYLPRIDKMILSSDGRFSLLKGQSAQTPQAPKNNNDSMGLFEIQFPPYTNDPKKVIFQTIENRRYTMQDIGILEKRIKNLEYYTSLSLLENDALSKTDASLYGRSKNGIITDSFVDFGVVDTNSEDFTAGIDVGEGELKTSTLINPFQLEFDAANSTNYSTSGSLLFMASNSNFVLAEQNFATSYISVNPYNVQLFVGSIRLLPQSDVWVDTNTLPDLLVQDPGNAHMIQNINNLNKWAEVEWGSWRRVSIGTKVVGTRVDRWENDKYIHWDHYEKRQTTEKQVRTGTKVTYQPTTVTKSLGERVVSSEIIPFIRGREVVYKAVDLQPLATVYPFFDNTNISNYVTTHNYFSFNTNRLGYELNNTPTIKGERIQIKNGTTILGNATAILLSNNRLYVSNVSVGQSINWTSGVINVFGVTSNTSLTLPTGNAYTFTTGFINASVTPTSTLFKLPDDANNATINIDIGSTPVRIVSGRGVNQSSTIIGYNPITRIVTVNPPFNVIPAANSIVQIGGIKADLRGRVSGSFYIPNGTFRTGERKFRLTDSSIGSFESAQTRADSSYYAQGTLETTQETVLSTIVPKTITTKVTDDRTLVTYSEKFLYQEAEKKDPIAQTFLVDKTQHPDGVFISKMRFCFYKKDSTLPITLQIRPTVNGYPSATQIFPFGEVSLSPDQVNTCDFPDLNDSTKYTEFVFESPIHLQPGEHSFVLLSNSNAYFAWIATKGQNDVNTSNPVNSQPFIGSFFKSQNGSTWTADQESDMMFRIYYHQFDTTTTTSIVCQLDSTNLPQSDVNVDVLVLQTQDVVFASNKLSYTFNSQSPSGVFTGYLPITPNDDYYMMDSYGRRSIKTSGGASSFSVKATLSTNNPDVTPIIDLERHAILAIEQVLNNLSLSNANMVVANTGAYSNANVTVTISGGGGNGATATANMYYNPIIAANVIDRIIVTGGGTGYKTSPTITLSGGGTATYPAVVSVNGEDSIRGGNSLCRYLTKRITLSDGFNCGDLRVYIAAHKPVGSSIDVYYKLLAGGDRELWQDKKWQLMTQIDNVNYYSESFDDFTELTFAPGTNGVPNNNIVYNSGLSGQFNDFNTFAIKIVLSGTNTVDIPRIRDFRAIAIPASY